MSHKNAEFHTVTPFPFNILEAIAEVSPQGTLLVPALTAFFLTMLFLR